MSLANAISLAAIGVVIVGLVGTMTYRLGRKIDNVNDNAEKRRSRIHDRITENDKDNVDKFVGQPVCVVRHENIADQLAGLNAKVETVCGDIKKLLAKNGIV